MVSFSGIDDEKVERDEALRKGISPPLAPDTPSRVLPIRANAPDLATVSEVPPRREHRILEAPSTSRELRDRPAQSRGLEGLRHSAMERQPQLRTSGTPQADLLVKALGASGSRTASRGRGRAAGARHADRLAGERLTSGRSLERPGSRKVHIP